MFEGKVGGALLAASQRHADRPALWVGGDTLSYRRLFQRALEIAASLRAVDLEPGERVAVLSHRSATAYAGVLGSLLAGGAYVPLNVRFPPERNQAILRASGARDLILDAACAENISSVLGDVPAGITVHTPDTVAGGQNLDDLAGELIAAESLGSQDQPAYILFTSGTTGAPKGVPITHANLAAYLGAISRLFTIGPDDRVLQAVDLTFDLSVHDMMLTWLNGATLYSVPENAAILAPRIIAQQAVTACLLVPSTGAQAGQGGLLKPGGLPSLRISLFAGEAFPVSVARAWGEAAPNSRIFNLYGPTEGTIHVSGFEFDRHQVMGYPVVPIGFPLHGQHMAVCDAVGLPLPDGETGEIYLAGPQMTRGYWGAPHLDKEKFVTLRDERWYKTGDLGRWVEPFGYIYAGRADRQVKIRGYRVELQEIEGALRQACGRDEVAVIAWPLTAEGVAEGCIAFVAGLPVDEDETLARCRESLPPYMVPQRVAQIDALPLNVNGKVDYRVLSDQAASVS